ncbi:hypothetical protein BGZ57DRAFT_958775 [Hyaloscypha finlandica]|nr:hypothetical protein BGZ57DRAFT_958775 [Hyaloscypha finlandica]
MAQDAKTWIPYGLFVLYPISEVHDDELKPDVDIMTIHGLNGASRGTWTDKSSEKFWLEDFLRDGIPYARVMTYCQGLKGLCG